MLSRKHYQQIAGIVSNAVRICEEIDDRETVAFIRDQVAYPLASLFEDDNPNFDVDKFLYGCYLRLEANK